MLVFGCRDEHDTLVVVELAGVNADRAGEQEEVLIGPVDVCQAVTFDGSSATICSTDSFASPKHITEFSLKNSGFCTPA